ncbi:MAG: hypothetical protein KF729_30530 [Sandaracinaceae bacterium]|nr:hypothetical protein [Sandaracinaceae bacterium]
MTALAVAFPSVRRTNEHWRRHHAAKVQEAEQLTLAKLWSAPERAAGAEPSAFERTMFPYLEDPFRGAVERRLRAPGERALSMELEAARGALGAAGVSTEQVDLTLVTSFVGDRFGVGDAAYLADALGLTTPAWNYETACSGSVVGLHMAASLVSSGEYGRVLVVASTSNSVQVVDDDSLGWFVGDGAGAFVVEPVAEGYGVLGHATLNSVGTNDMFVIHSVPDGAGGTRLCTRANERAAEMARDTAEPYLRATVSAALARASVVLGDVDFWVFNTPNAWYADFCALALGVAPGRYHSVYPRYANIGAALMPATLYHALHERRVGPGALVGMYSIGSTSTASAVIARLGEVALGPYPEPPPVSDEPTQEVRGAPARALERSRTNEEGGDR